MDWEFIMTSHDSRSSNSTVFHSFDHIPIHALLLGNLYHKGICNLAYGIPSVTAISTHILSLMNETIWGKEC